MNNSGPGSMGNSGSPMHDMNSPLGPNAPLPGGPNGPMGSPMGGMGGPGPNNMMVPNSKSSPMGMSGGGGPNGPDPTQPLPPSGLSGNGYNKNSPIMGPGPGPVSSDPNYSQQFLNFQQQLYATNTRGGGGPGPGGPGGPGMSPGMGMPPHRTNTPPGFNQNWQSTGPLSK